MERRAHTDDRIRRCCGKLRAAPERFAASAGSAKPPTTSMDGSPVARR